MQLSPVTAREKSDMQHVSETQRERERNRERGRDREEERGEARENALL